MYTFLFFILSTSIASHLTSNKNELADEQAIYPISILIDESNDQEWSPHKINRIGWTATADSEQATNSEAAEGPISNILDGNINTIWHSKHNNNGQGGHESRTKTYGPFKFTINLGRETTFKAFSYMPRQDGDPNGKFRIYEFYAAKTEDELNTNIQDCNYISKGIIDNTTLKLTLIILPHTETAQYVALRSLDHDTFASCAEFNLYRDPKVPTPTPLAYLISESRDQFWKNLKIDRSAWIVTANSEENDNANHNEGPASYIKDGNAGTMWHTKHTNGHDDQGNPDDPFRFTIDLGQETIFRAFAYMPRPTGVNGKFRQFEFYIAQTSDELNTKIANNQYSAKGDIDVNSPLSTLVVFYGPQKARFVSLLSINPGQYATCAEFNLFRDSKDIPQFITSYYVNEDSDKSWSPFQIDRNGWVASANSEQNVNDKRTEGPASFVLDGKLNTMWHSNYNTNGHDERGSNTDPFQLTINLGKETTFKAFAYMPRRSGNNGQFEHYEFYAAKTSEELSDMISNTKYLAKGDIDNTTYDSTFVSFESEVTAQYVALLSLHFANNYATCTEFNLFYNTPFYQPPEPTPTPLPKPVSTKLVFDESANHFWLSYRMDRSEWKARANSEEAINREKTEGPVSFILDEGVGTMWHTRHSNGHDERQKDTDPFQITLDLGKQRTFKAFAYMPRTGPADANGRFKQYEFYSANTSEELFTKIRDNDYISKGDIDSTSLLSTFIVFAEPQTAQHIALLSINPGSYGTCAEFNLYSTPIALEPDQSVMTNQVGLINLTCDKFTYENWPESGQCVSSTDANHGSLATQAGAKARVTFNGIKVHVLAMKETTSGLAYINIDGSTVAFVDFRSYTGQNLESIVFSSNDLEYGEHTIEIETLTPSSVIFGSVYVNPLPKENSYILGYSDFKAIEGDWTSDSSSTPPVFTSDSNPASGVFEFYGTRFWLTGVRGNGVGDFQISIDEGEPIAITESKTEEIAQNNKAVCLYNSGLLEFKMHNVKIQKTNSRISLMNFLYTWHPNNETPAPTSSPIPTPEPPDIIYDDSNYTESKPGRTRIEKVIQDNDDTSNVTITVKMSNFTSIENDDGGAIHIKNCGLKTEGTVFTDCISGKGGGGAIYVQNSLSSLNTVNLKGLTFIRCSAEYGGGAYIYSSSESNLVEIEKCIFKDNVATKEDSPDGVFGGSAVFLRAMRASVVRCKLSNNNIKIFQEFPSSANLLNNPNRESLLTLSHCHFEVDKNMKFSVFVHNDKSASQILLTGCTFSGKLQEGAYFIDGQSTNKNLLKLSIKSCKFSSKLSKVLNQNAKFASFNFKDQNFEFIQIDEQSEKKMNKFKFMPILAILPSFFVAVFSALIVSIVIARKKRNNAKDYSYAQKELNESSQSL